MYVACMYVYVKKKPVKLLVIFLARACLVYSFDNSYYNKCKLFPYLW